MNGLALFLGLEPGAKIFLRGDQWVMEGRDFRTKTAMSYNVAARWEAETAADALKVAIRHRRAFARKEEARVEEEIRGLQARGAEWQPLVDEAKAILASKVARRGLLEEPPPVDRANTHAFYLVVGDVSHDGHARSERYAFEVKSVWPDALGAMEEIRAAVRRATKIRPKMHPGRFCTEDDVPSEAAREGYERLGVQLKHPVLPRDMAACVRAFIRLGNEDLDPVPCSPEGATKIPQHVVHGIDPIFGMIGYGCWS